MNELHAKFDPRTARSALTALRGGYGAADTTTTEALFRRSGTPNRSETPLDQIRRPDSSRSGGGPSPHTMGQSPAMGQQNTSIYGGSNGSRPPYNLLSHSSGPMQSPSMQMSGGGGGHVTTQARQGGSAIDHRSALHALLGPSAAALGAGPDQLIQMMLRGGFGPGSGQR